MPLSKEAGFLESVCLPFLLAAQNPDGGWGFRVGFESRVEPTAWALLALRGAEWPNTQRAGYRFLSATQLPDGSWPSSPTQKVGSWVTSVASWALSADEESSKSVGAALNWICADQPRSSRFAARLIRRIAAPRKIVVQDDSLEGWGWTPRTANWVEPTALALIALEQAPSHLLPSGDAKRRESATALIYDRMCPGGGWNCGNPMVYGVPGDALVEPTVWALIALRRERKRRENVMSLGWLLRTVSRVLGPGSLALASICLEIYREDWPETAPDLSSLYGVNEILGNVMVMAWMCLALRRGTDCLRDDAKPMKSNANA